MVNQVAPPTTQACEWMRAGVLTYRLCNRNFDCEHCPLDAALRCMPRRVAERCGEVDVAPPRPVVYPDDRVYTTGHTWLRPVAGENGHVRFGLDGFATSIMGGPCGVKWMTVHGILTRGEALCEVEFEAGPLILGIPVTGCVSRWNRALEADPAAIITAPYENGWLVELAPTGHENLDTLLAADEARHQARLDARLFLRHAAMQMLFDGVSIVDADSNGGGALTDLRRILGEGRCLDLVRELVH